MAAAGTGLPSADTAATTPLVDMRGYGAGEQAAAEGFARAAQELDGLVRQVEPAAQQAAKTIAEQEVAAGQFRERVAITGADAAFNEAMRSGTLARLGNSRDADLTQFATQFAYDPEGYATAASQYRADALSSGVVPGALAESWAQEFDQRNTRILGTIRSARAERDLGEAKADLTAQSERLITETVGMSGGRPVGDVFADPDVATNILMITRNIDALVSNPAFGVSEEEGAALRDAAIARIKAGAVASAITAVYRSEGSDAALAQLQGVLTDPDGFNSEAERQLAYNLGREAVNQELGLERERRNVAEQERNDKLREVGRLIDEDVARYALTGEGSGLSEAQVRELGGEDAVLRWYKARGDAASQAELFRDLPNDPDEAAQIIASRAMSRGLGAIPPVQDGGDLSTIANAIAQVESGNRDGLVSADPDGAGPAGGGAYGRMQILPETARRMATQLGLPFDLNRLRNDAAYNRQIGTAYLSELITRYNGDTFLAITAYHAGEGNVDSWLRTVGDPRNGTMSRERWLQGVEARGNPRSAEYPRKVLAALNAGAAGAAWDSYRGQQTVLRTDPVSAVQQDPVVRLAQRAWAEGGYRSVTTSQAMVQANLDAQERIGVPAGNRRTLTNATLVQFAGEVQRFVDTNDTEGFTAYGRQIVSRFGTHGERVWQDVLEVRGDTRLAAQVAARAAALGAAGQRPTQRDVEQAGVAERTTRINAAAGGRQSGARGMSNEELLAQLRGSPVD